MATGTCETCGDDYPLTRRWQPDYECPRCEAVAMQEARDAFAGVQFDPPSRKEQMRERLGVSGDVDE